MCPVSFVFHWALSVCISNLHCVCCVRLALFSKCFCLFLMASCQCVVCIPCDKVSVLFRLQDAIWRGRPCSSQPVLHAGVPGAGKLFGTARSKARLWRCVLSAPLLKLWSLFVAWNILEVVVRLIERELSWGLQ
jgi:hypothetical protein